MLNASYLLLGVALGFVVGVMSGKAKSVEEYLTVWQTVLRRLGNDLEAGQTVEATLLVSKTWVGDDDDDDDSDEEEEPTPKEPGSKFLLPSRN